MRKGVHRRLARKNIDLKQAYEAGYRFAVVAPKGNVISLHAHDRGAVYGLQCLRNAGCRKVDLKSFIEGEKCNVNG